MMGTYMIDTVVLRKHNGTAEWQEPSATTDETLKAFIDYKARQVNNAMGQLVVSMAKVTIRPRTIIVSGFSTRAAGTISYKDKIVFDGLEHGIVMIGKMRDFSVRGLEVYVT